MKSKVVTLESPYAPNAETGATIETHVAYAHRAMRDCIDRGEAPYASHLLYPHVLDEFNPAERALGIQLGYEWMIYADEVVVYTDYGISHGMKAAIEYATANEITVVYRSIGGNP